MAAPTFCASHFCTFAQSLRLRWDQDEASVRTSISRAYYGAFLEARDAIGASSKGDRGHSEVISAYSGRGSVNDTLIARSLRSMKKLREKADYDAHLVCTKRDAEDAMSEAKKVLKSLGVPPTLLPDLVPIQLKPAAAPAQLPPVA